MMNLEALLIPEDLLLSAQGHVALITLNRPPHNFFDLTWIRELASIFEGLDIGEVDLTDAAHGELLVSR